MANLIGMNANQVPTNGMLGTLAFQDTLSYPASNVTTATTATTLTSISTLLQITPASYGVAVTLPDATTCNIGGPLHIIDNKGAYPVRVLNSAGTLLGFIFAGVVSHISLTDKSTAAGVWTIENNELVGASAQLLTTNMAFIDAVIDIGSSQEVIIGRGVSSANCYGVVYNRSTNTFGSVTLIRTATFGSSLIAACLSGANQVLVCSVATGATSFEAVALSISGTTITVNTAATATLSANISAFADGCGLIAVGSSFVTSYTVATPAAQIRALSISGTTVTIGSATVLPGTSGGLQTAIGSVDVVTSGASTTMYATPYTVSGATLTIGTQATIVSGGAEGGPTKQVLLGTGNIFLAYYSAAKVALAKLTGTTVTLSDLGTTLISAVSDAIVVGSNKVLVLANSSSSNANILTDTAGTASAGTAITLDGQATKACLYVSGTDVAVQSGTTTYLAHMVDCSGASPVRTSTITTGGSNVESAAFSTSNAVLSRSPKAVYGTAYARNVWMSAVTQNFDPEIKGGVFRRREHTNVPGDNTSPGVAYRGKSASEIWIADATTVITKLECVA